MQHIATVVTVYLASTLAVVHGTSFAMSRFGAQRAALHTQMLLNANSREALARVMRGTTLESALETLGNSSGTPNEVKSFLQVATKGREKGFLASQAFGKVGDAKSLDKAKTMLTEMIQKTEGKLDLEQIRCSSYDRAQRILIEGTRADISTLNAEAAAAREQILQAEQIIELATQKLPELNFDLMKHEYKCSADIAILQRQLAIIAGDLAVMGQILAKTDCSGSTTTLLQCIYPDTGESFLTFSHKTLRAKVAQLHSDATRKALQQSLIETSSSTATTTPSTVQIISNPTMPTSSVPADRKQQQAKCAFNNATNCNKLRERFLTIDAGIREKQEELRRQLGTTQSRCSITTADYMSEIKNYEVQLKASQTSLASATKQQNEAEAASRLKNIALIQLMRDHDREMRECRKNILNFQGEICAVRKIRGELFLMKGGNIYGANIHIQDCEVSGWDSGPCPVTCGGSTVTLTRSVLTPAKNGGAVCPPLQMEEKCGEDDCPVNCQLGEWSGWSTCSAECGGGIREREREVEVEANNGGDPCGETSETASCGIASCDKDCELAPWTGWTTCSKVCGGGSQRRSRSVEEPKQGDGKCADDDDDTRLELRPCNAQPCTPVAPVLHCDSKLDVVLLLDSSGSLRQAGWDATKAVAKMLINAFKGSQGVVRLAVQLFSGPPSYSKARQCANNPNGLNPETDCGIQWLSHLTEDLDAVETAVAGSSWIRSFTCTSLALGLAESELPGGRTDAQSVVIVITDGRPLSRVRTSQAARRVRKVARLLFVPVTRYAPIRDIQNWASKPTHENVVSVPDFNTLTQPATVTTLIADVCPKAS